jgi:hypothetical protein
MEVLKNEQEFSDIHIFQHSGKGIPLFMTGHKNDLQSDYLLGPGPRLSKKRIYRAAVSQRLRNTDVEFLDNNKFGKLVRLLVLLKINLLRCTVT